jgi:uncharacterized membrane protein YfcA
MSVPLIIIATVFATSVLSGIIGMAGGIILMAVLVSVQSVAAAMIIHGTVQATANGSRAFFLRRHIVWQILPGYLGGAAVALIAFIGLAVVPDSGIILLIIGAFPWAARAMRGLHGLDITRRGVPVVCGVLVTGAQLFAGASGPLLDVFYLDSRLDRRQVVATKAVTQTLGHVLKLIYYGLIIGLTEPIELWFLGVAVATAVLGTRVGTLILMRFDETRFRQLSGWVILAIGALCIVKGARDLWGVA